MMMNLHNLAASHSLRFLPRLFVLGCIVLIMTTITSFSMAWVHIPKATTTSTSTSSIIVSHRPLHHRCVSISSELMMMMMMKQNRQHQRVQLVCAKMNNNNNNNNGDDYHDDENDALNNEEEDEFTTSSRNNIIDIQSPGDLQRALRSDDIFATQSTKRRNSQQQQRNPKKTIWNEESIEKLRQIAFQEETKDNNNDNNKKIKKNFTTTSQAFLDEFKDYDDAQRRIYGDNEKPFLDQTTYLESSRNIRPDGSIRIPTMNGDDDDGRNKNRLYTDAVIESFQPNKNYPPSTRSNGYNNPTFSAANNNNKQQQQRPPLSEATIDDLINAQNRYRSLDVEEQQRFGEELKRKVFENEKSYLENSDDFKSGLTDSTKAKDAQMKRRVGKFQEKQQKASEKLSEAVEDWLSDFDQIQQMLKQKREEQEKIEEEQRRQQKLRQQKQKSSSQQPSDDGNLDVNVDSDRNDRVQKAALYKNDDNNVAGTTNGRVSKIRPSSSSSKVRGNSSPLKSNGSFKTVAGGKTPTQTDIDQFRRDFMSSSGGGATTPAASVLAQRRRQQQEQKSKQRKKQHQQKRNIKKTTPNERRRIGK